MLFNVTVVGDKELIGQLDAMPEAVAKALTARVGILAARLQSWIVTKKLRGQVLKQRSGQLVRSIKEKVEASQYAVYGRVFSSGDVKYAGIHEFGGTIKHPGGTLYRIDKATGLAVFLSNKSEAAAWAYPRTRPHDIPMPERSFMRSSLRDMKPTIERELIEVAIAAAQGSVS